MSGAGADLVRPLPWDSEFWGIEVATIDAVDAAGIEAGDDWCLDHGVEVAFLQLPGDGPGEVLDAARRRGFAVVERSVVVGRSLVDLAPGHDPDIGPARSDDLAALRSIARHDLRGLTRFYRDPGFDDRRVDDFYERWVDASFEGWADAVLVLRDGDVPLGCVTGHAGEGLATSRVGLLLVGPPTPWQRVVVASRLLHAMFARLASEGATEVRLTTQEHNRPTLRLLANLGCEQIETWQRLHRWYSA